MLVLLLSACTLDDDGASGGDGPAPAPEGCDAATWHADADGDGFGDASAPTEACAAPEGHVADATDCDDTLAARFPGNAEVCDQLDNDCDGDADEDAVDAATWGRDADGDTFAGDGPTVTQCEAPVGYAAAFGDCDDLSRDVSPLATEVCDAADIDEDCDGLVDDDDASTDPASWGTWYADRDGDAYGDASRPVSLCEEPAGHVADATDCDDADAAVSPAGTEVCNDVDDDCDDATDEDAADALVWFADVDGDGYGGELPASACDAPAGHVATSTDCDDADAAVSPAGTEVCNDVDDDCDGAVDTDAVVAPTWYADADDDGYGGAVGTAACDAPAGHVATSTDCDDADAAVSPAGVETCDAADVDEDCDGLVDDDDPGVAGGTTWYPDDDADGFGGSASVLACAAPPGALPEAGDCDDDAPATYPGAEDTCEDGVDQDCDGADDACPGYRGSFAASAGYDTKIYGSSSYDYAGEALVGGDFDGDGVGDLVLGASGYNVGADDGAAFGVLGPLPEGSSTHTAAADFSYTGGATYDATYAKELWSVGDLDGDGTEELFVYGDSTEGHIFASPHGSGVGAAHDDVFANFCRSGAWAGNFGGEGTRSWFCGANYYDRVYVYQGLSASSERAEITGITELGWAMGDARDIDGDGFDDAWLGAPNALGFGVLFYGPAAGDLSAYASDALVQGDGEYLGYDVETTEDVDGDGSPDLLVTGRWSDLGGSHSGAAYLITEPASGAVASVAAAVIPGPAASAFMHEVESGDFDGDGLADLLLGSPQSGGYGEVFLLYGPVSGTIDLATDADAVWLGDAANDQLGYAIAAVPDTNGDGMDELAFGAPYDDDGARTDAGSVFIWLGQ